MQKFVYKAVCLYYKIVKKIKRKMQIICDALNITNQKILIFDALKIIKSAPLILPKLPRWNKPFRVLITNAGDWGWISDKSGFKYVKKHPKTGKIWPKIPSSFFGIWKKFSCSNIMPNSCLINLYKNINSRLGLHQDKDENDFSVPVLTISIGSSCKFNYGKTKEIKLLKTFDLKTGSIVLLSGGSRLYYHSVSKILKTEKNILHNENPNIFPRNSRLSITLRRFKEKS